MVQKYPVWKRRKIVEVDRNESSRKQQKHGFDVRFPLENRN